MELTQTNNGRWKPGQSGNLNGRPVGSNTRHQFPSAPNSLCDICPGYLVLRRR